MKLSSLIFSINLFKKQAGLINVPASIVDMIFFWVREQYCSELLAIKKFKLDRLYDKDTINQDYLISLAAIIAECKKYAQTKHQYFSHQSTISEKYKLFEIDTSIIPYKKLSDNLDIANIFVRIKPQLTSSNKNATFYGDVQNCDGIIDVFMNYHIDDLTQLNKELSYKRKTLEHELVHFIQYYIFDKRGGFHKNIQEVNSPELDQNIKHTLRDIEFYPNLLSERKIHLLYNDRHILSEYRVHH